MLRVLVRQRRRREDLNKVTTFGDETTFGDKTTFRDETTFGDDYVGGLKI